MTVRRVWLFDLDDTLHDAASASMPGIHLAMGEYIQTHLGLTHEESNALRRRYWLRYGATLLGLIRHHGVDADHFLHQTHQLPGLEAAVRGHRHDLVALRRLPGRKVLLTNAPAAYAQRVLLTLGLQSLFERVITIEQMRMFGELRPKPDARMLRWIAARLGVLPRHCVLVEDTLVHLKSARAVGMGTVWMTRWLAGRNAAAAALRRHRRPVYVDRPVRRLAQLLRG